MPEQEQQRRRRRAWVQSPRPWERVRRHRQAGKRERESREKEEEEEEEEVEKEKNRKTQLLLLPCAQKQKRAATDRFRGASRQSNRLSRSLTSFTTAAGIVSVPAGQPEALKTVTWTPERGVIGAAVGAAAAAAAAFLVSPAALERATAAGEAASTGAARVPSAPATAATAAERASRAITKEKKARPRAMVTGGSGEGRARDGEERVRCPNFFFFLKMISLPPLFDPYSKALHTLEMKKKNQNALFALSLSYSV